MNSLTKCGRDVDCFCVQTIQKVLVAYAELVRKDFSQFTSKHDVVSSPLRCVCLFLIVSE